MFGHLPLTCPLCVWGELDFTRKQLQDLKTAKNLNLDKPLNPAPKWERTILGLDLSLCKETLIVTTIVWNRPRQTQRLVQACLR